MNLFLISKECADLIYKLGFLGKISSFYINQNKISILKYNN